MNIKHIITALLCLALSLPLSVVYAEGVASTAEKIITLQKKPKKFSKWAKSFSKKLSGNKDKIGATVGGVVGGIIGSKLGAGHEGKDFAIATGIALGALIGNQIGEQLNQRDKDLHAQAIEAALSADLGATESWANSETQNKGSIQTVSAYVKNQLVCKDVDAIITTHDGATDKQTVTGCQGEDGGWTLVN